MMGTGAKWTFMVYMAGDNDLSIAGETDLAEMRAIGSTAEVNVLVEFDRKGCLGTNRSLIRRDGVEEHGIQLGETDAADPKVLTAYASWAVRNHPAERYALVLWSHGSGWEPSEMDGGAISADPGRDNKQKKLPHKVQGFNKPFFLPTIKTLSKSRANRRAIVFDDGSGHSLDTVELGRILKQVTRMIGQPLDILGMDACLMSNLEVAYQVKNYVRYLVASEEKEPDTGWPYSEMLKRLTEFPHQTTDSLAAHMVTTYVQSCIDCNASGPATLSAIDLAEIDHLALPLDKLAEALITRMPKASRDIFNAQRDSARFQHDTLWDISDFCLKLEKKTSCRAVRAAAREVRSALLPGSGRFVITNAHAGAEFENCGGVSIYLQPLRAPLSKHYSKLDFAREHQWLPMLKAYHNNPV